MKDIHTTTAFTGTATPVSVESIEKAMREIGLLPKLDQWVVIDPQGRLYRGKFEDVFPVLVAHHPLLKMPTPPRRMWPDSDG